MVVIVVGGDGGGWGLKLGKVHKVLCLPRNLHFKVHQVLHLPRELHFKVHKVY